MPADYTARIVDVPGRGVRPGPAPGSAVPDQPNGVGLLAIGRAASGMFTCTVRYLPAGTPQAGPGGL